MSVLIDLQGVNGQVELHEDKVIIKRKGAISKLTQGFFKGDKTIYLSQISGIQVKPGSLVTNGYIQFTLSGGNESTKGIFNATKDENTVMFAKKHNELVAQMQAKIEELKNVSQRGATPLSSADEIMKFKQLLNEGIITQEQFETKKLELLG